MKCNSLSATSLSAWLTCGLKFKFVYIDRISRKQTIYFKFGSAIHTALEMAGLKNMDYTVEIDDKFKEDIINIFVKEAAKQKLDDVTLLKEGKEILLKKLDTFKFGKRILSVEERFETDVGIGVPLIGQIDKIVELTDDALAIVDYKTSKLGLNSFQLKKDIQLSVYDLVVSYLYPEYSKRVLIMDYVRSRPVYSDRTDDERELFLEFLKSVVEEIKSTDEKELKPELNKYCSSCDYRFLCPAYYNAVNNVDNTYTPADLLSDDELVEEWDRLRNAKKAIDERMMELKMIITDRLKDEDYIEGATKKIIPRQNSRKYYDTKVLLGKIPKKDLLPLISFNTKKVDEYLESKDEKFKNAIISSAKYSLNKPWYDVVDK